MIPSTEYYSLSLMTFKTIMAGWIVMSLEAANLKLPFDGLIGYILDTPSDPLRNAWILRMILIAKMGLGINTTVLPTLPHPDPETLVEAMVAAASAGPSSDANAAVIDRVRSETQAFEDTLRKVLDLGVETITPNATRGWSIPRDWLVHDPDSGAVSGPKDEPVPVWSPGGEEGEYMSARLTSRIPVLLFQALAAIARHCDEGHYLPSEVYCFVGQDTGEVVEITSRVSKANRLPLLVRMEDDALGISFDITSRYAVLSRGVKSAADRARAEARMRERGVDLSKYQWIEVQVGALSVPHIGFRYHNVRQKFTLRNVNSWHANATRYGGLLIAEAERYVTTREDPLATELNSMKRLTISSGTPGTPDVSFRLKHVQGLRTHVDTGERLHAPPGVYQNLRIDSDPLSRIMLTAIILAHPEFVDAAWDSEWASIGAETMALAPYAELVPRLPATVHMSDLRASSLLWKKQSSSWATSAYLDDAVADIPDPLRTRAHAVFTYLHIHRASLYITPPPTTLVGSVARNISIGGKEAAVATAAAAAAAAAATAEQQQMQQMQQMQQYRRATLGRESGAGPLYGVSFEEPLVGARLRRNVTLSSLTHQSNDLPTTAGREEDHRGGDGQGSLAHICSVLRLLESEETRLFALFDAATQIQSEYVALGVLWRLLQIVNIDNNGFHVGGAERAKPAATAFVHQEGSAVSSGVQTLDAKSERLARLKAKRAAKVKARKAAAAAAKIDKTENSSGAKTLGSLLAAVGEEPSAPDVRPGGAATILEAAKFNATVKFFRSGVHGLNILHMATGANLLNVVHYILALGVVNIKQRSGDGKTALSIAVSNSPLNINVVRLLLLAGARADEACGLNHETTVLHMVAEEGRVEVMRTIIELVPDTRFGVLDAHGRTALQASTGGEMEAVLKEVTPELPPNFNVIDFGEVHLGSRLGEGGFCVVYAGEYSGWSVAVKQMKVTAKEQQKDKAVSDVFVREIGFLTALVHPNIVRLYGVSQGGIPLRWHIVTELCEQGTLSEVLDDAETLSWSVLHSVALDVVRALTYLHSRVPAVFHCDIKPANILLDKSMRARLSDFGLSREDNVSTLVEGESRTSIVGTVRYIAPEIMAGGVAAFTRKADVFSFGVMLWEMMYAYVFGTHVFPYASSSASSSALSPFESGSTATGSGSEFKGSGGGGGNGDSLVGEGGAMDSHLVLLISSGQAVLDMHGIPKNGQDVLRMLTQRYPGGRPLFSELGAVLDGVKELKRNE